MSLLLQILVLAAAALYFYIQPDALNKLDDNKAETKVEENGQFMKDLSLTEFKADASGKKDWNIKASQARSSSSDSVWTILEAHTSLFKDNQKVVDITAPEGEVDTTTKNFVLKNDVVSKMESGYLFRSKGLTYEATEERFYSVGEIYIEGPSRSTILKGSSFIGSLKVGSVYIRGPIYCEQSVPNYEKPIIKSNSAKIDIRKRHVQFIGRVLITIGDMNITAESAEFEYNKKKGDLEVLRILGQVFASQANQSASADVLEIRVKEGVFLFQGNPRFVSGGNTLVGNEILLYNKGRSVQILKGRVKTESEINIIEGN